MAMLSFGKFPNPPRFCFSASAQRWFDCAGHRSLRQIKTPPRQFSIPTALMPFVI
jgi:hypothetical protein